MRLDKALADAVPEGEALSRSRLRALIEDGAVRVDGNVVRDPATKVSAQARAEIAIPPAQPTELRAQAILLDVVHEDADLIVVNKPAGMVVHPGAGVPDGTLVNALMHHCGASLSGIGGAARPGIVHRIDKDTTGLLVAAKSDRAHQGLAAQFEAHSVERHYTALCIGVPQRGDPRLAGLDAVSFESGGVIVVRANIARHRTDRQRMAVTRTGGRHAVTRVRVVEAFHHAAALIDCWLETGRTHQIRVHLAHVGHPLIGDPVYGGGRTLRATGLPDSAVAAAAAFPRQALHAATLGFDHPVTGERLSFEAPLPSDLATLIDTFHTQAC